MTAEQVHTLVTTGWPNELAEKIETHISWVILCGDKVYKIKKPVHYSFLDFSTMEKRKYYCERELGLNRRFAENLYLGVEPVRQEKTGLKIGGGEGRSSITQ